MKKFLSLVLALTMMMSLVTINAGAKEFKDDKDITYDEAVAVISEIGVVDGREDGSFAPTDNLSRGAAAKIICNLILGPTTAAELHADTAPYKDVPTSNTFSGYIAYCAKEGIISGYADGTFRPAGTLTGYAFMKMLLGALGYDATYEGYTGGNWSINVAKQAIGIGLNAGLTDEFNGVDFVTREEAALYAFNTLQATMVDYDQKITTNVNGVDVTISQGSSKPVTWSEGINEDGNIKNDGFVQFAEEFFPKLECRKDSDDFMRPANNWVYDKTDIGTYVDHTLLVESYTTGVTGKTVYDLLKSGVIDKNKLESYVDGKENSIKKTDLVRSNNNDLTGTGDGVVTEVYLDSDDGMITIVSVNSYLAKATSDYSESKEYAPLNVYVKDADGRNYNVDVEDVANVVDVKNDTYYQVNISYKDNDTLGEVKAVSAVEVLEDSTVTKFSTSKNDETNKDQVSKVTIGGEEYKANVKAFYDKDVLNEYNESLLTDNTYTVYVDANGYFLGIELFEGTKNYVFIPGYDLDGSHIGTSTAKASAIFLDGTMKTITVDVKDTNTNIEKARTDASNNAPTADDHAAMSFNKWSGGNEKLNQWYTYTVDADGTYTLKPAVRMTTTAYTDTAKEDVIRTDNLSIVGDSKNDNRVYGEDATVFVTVDLDAVSAGSSAKVITDVDGVYTGVQNVDIEIDKDAEAVALGQVFTVYDSDYYVIGAVVIGEATGSAQNLAYILSGAKSEEKKDDTYYWTFEAVLNGQVQTLTAKSKYSSTITPLTKGTVMELRFDGDYVTSIKAVKAEDVYTNMKVAIDGEDVYQMVGLTANTSTLNLQGRTMYITANREDVGLAFASDAKAVVIQDENKKSDVKTEFTSVGSAISHLADADTNTAGTQYAGNIYAVLNSNGLAQWVVFDSATPLNTGSQGGDFTDNGTDTTLPSTTDLFVDFTGTEKGAGRYDAKNGKLYLQFTDLTPGASKVSLPGVYVSDAVGGGKYVDINDLGVVKTTNLDGKTSKVYVMDYKATELTGTVIVGNKITVQAATENVTEWYVKYSGSAEYANKTETVKNVADTEFTFTVKQPAGSSKYDIQDNSSANITAVRPAALAQSNLTVDQAYTVKLTAAGTQPEVKLNYNNAAVTVTSSVKSGAVNGKGVDAAYFSGSETSKSVNSGAQATVNLTVQTGTALVASTNQVVVEYTVNGTPKSMTHAATASATQTVAIQETVNANTEIVVTGVKVQAKVTVAENSLDAATTTNLTGNATATYNGKNKAAIESEWLDVGSTVAVVVTVPGVSGNGVTITIAGQGTDVTTGTDVEVEGSYTVVAGTNALTVQAGNKV
ncbi:S-layer homology domain-containing protein [Oscillibacter valericigenes]|nr:S-layer homology domain-containing protein [Oscillibacter valericigenes]